MITMSTTVRLRSDVRHRLVGENTVVLCQAPGEILVLNQVGGRVLQCVDGVTPASGIAEKLLGVFAVDRKTLETDVVRFLQQLVDRGAAELVEGSEEPR